VYEEVKVYVGVGVAVCVYVGVIVGVFDDIVSVGVKEGEGEAVIV